MHLIDYCLCTVSPPPRLLIMLIMLLLLLGSQCSVVLRPCCMLMRLLAIYGSISSVGKGGGPVPNGRCSGSCELPPSG
eukprot:COSAG01_NODE_6526_length_3621_cov_4.911414_2_plen_78_part_00